ncbi:MAG: hypothetical protein WD491_07710 [Balneolales bacterium]
MKTQAYSMVFDIVADKLIPHYRKFDVDNRMLFTGHSHQAWPDVAYEGQMEAFEEAARLVDNKWEAAFHKTNILRRYLRDYYDDPDGQYSLATSTHELVVKWLSALDLKNKPRLITTDSEFYTIHRQLKRLKEADIEVAEIPSLPLEGFAERLEKTMTDKTSAVLISRVYFESSLINREIREAAELCRKYGVPMLIDDYHGTNVIPLSIRDEDLEDCYLLIGGYKYLQWGEGNCFLRYPHDCSLRPVVTGWFASFSTLSQPRHEYTVQYDVDQRFSGATYDSVSQFRAARVVEFFRDMNLSPPLLFENYRRQVSYLKECFLDLGIDPSIITLKHEYPITDNGGFLALSSPRAGQIWKDLKERGVSTDFRGDTLRLGPAPYVRGEDIEEFMEVLKEVVS